MDTDSAENNTYNELSELIAINNLSVRATNVLLQNVKYIEELLSLDEEAILNFPNCGIKTVKEILAFQNKIRADRFIPATFSEKQPSKPSPSIENRFKEPPSEESLSLLPLFSSLSVAKTDGLEITPDDLHPDFYVSTKLSDLALSTRTSKILRNLGIETIGEILFVSGYSLLRKKNFGRNSLAELKDIVRSICLSDVAQSSSGSTQIDYSSYQSMISTFLKQSGISKHQENKRNEDIIFKRFCFQEGKVPTLEELGQDFGITRERARQILLKATTTLQIKSNLDKLAYFWECIDSVVAQGGGIIHLVELPAVLQTEFNWSNLPYYRALGQLLLLREPNVNLKEESDIISLNSPCLNCDVPLNHLLSLDFDSIESYHFKVLASKLSSNCKDNCPSNYPLQTFHNAFIEHLIDKSGERLALHDDLVLSYNKWVVKYSGNLEGIICHVLENHGKPMHFTEIAEAVRHISPKHAEISDNNIHGAMQRYGKIEIISRGTYGLKSWGMGGYRSVSTAIEEVIDQHKRPLKRMEIIDLLDGQFAENNISSALGHETRFIAIGEGFYDLPAKWQQRNINDFIERLPEPVAEFARYLVSKNNCSYKLVLALVFIRGMDNNGSFYLPTLKERFFSYYLNRKKKGLVVEADNVTISKINSVEDGFIRSATNKPIESFLNSDFFVKDNLTILLQPNLVALLSNTTTQNLLIIILLKAIDDYFLQLSPSLSLSAISDNSAVSDNPSPFLNDEPTSVNNTSHSKKEPKEFSPVYSYNNSDDGSAGEENSFSISIKSRDKAKIKI